MLYPPTVDECVGMEVWFILVISIRSVGPWEGLAIKSRLWLGLFNTVSVKWLKVNGTLTQSDRNSFGSCCCIKVVLIHCSTTLLWAKDVCSAADKLTLRCCAVETLFLVKDVSPTVKPLLWGKRYPFPSCNIGRDVLLSVPLYLKLCSSWIILEFLCYSQRHAWKWTWGCKQALEKKRKESPSSLSRSANCVPQPHNSSTKSGRHPHFLKHSLLLEYSLTCTQHNAMLKPHQSVTSGLVTRGHRSLSNYSDKPN